MIKYQKGWGGLALLLRFAGTAWPGGVLPGLFSASIGLILGLVEDLDEFITDDKRFVENPYPFQLFAYLVGFVLVFRTNFGYLRYWEAMDDVQSMGCKWLDAAVQTIVFDARGDVAHPYLQSSVEVCEDEAHDIDDADAPTVSADSKRLRLRSASLELTQKSLQKSASTVGKNPGVKHEEFFVEVVHLFSLMHALALQHLRQDSDLSNLEGKVETNLPRLTLMSAKPQYTVSKTKIASLSGFWDQSRGYKQDDEAMKLRVLGGLSEEERSCLTQDSHGQAVPTAARVSMVQSWLMRRVTGRQKHEPAGDMGKTPPPILSRMVQNISDGHYGFSQAAKVAETPFPFPYQNLIRVFLWIFATSAPLVINSKLIPPSARFVVNFVAVWAYFSLAEVGDNMEDPFMAYDPNDLPLEAIQHSYNARLLSFGVVPR